VCETPDDFDDFHFRQKTPKNQENPQRGGLSIMPPPPHIKPENVLKVGDHDRPDKILRFSI
jgi:hypothetical protein